MCQKRHVPKWSEGKFEGSNFVTSAYGKQDFISHIEAVISNDALVYANKNKTRQLFSGSELELLTRLNNLGFDKIIHPSRNIVKTKNGNSFSFSSPKTDNAPAGVEDFDVKPNNEVSPELQKQLDDHVFNVQSDGSVRALAQERMEQAQRKYRLALASAKGVRGGKSEYKIITLPDGRKYVQADRNAISEKDVSLISNEIERRINSEIRHGRNVSVIAEDGELLSITKDTAWKAGSRKIGEAKNGEPILMPEEKYRTKINAELHIDEIAKVSKRTSKTVPDKKDHDFAKDGFHYRTAYYRDYDGRYYKLGLSVGGNNEVKTVYNIGSIRKETPIPHWGSKAGAQKRKDYGVSNNDYSNPTVKSQEGFYEETDFARALRLAQEKKNQFSFASPKSDSAPAGVEDFDVKANSEVGPELQKQLDDHVFNVQSDGSVRTLAQERMEQNIAEIFSNRVSGINVSTEGLTRVLADKNKARTAFVQFSKSFPKFVINQNTRKQIDISRKGIDKFLSGDINKEKLATGYKIPELIETAQKVAEADYAKDKTGIKGYEYYQNSIVIDGKNYNVHIRVRYTDMGDKYYGHTISKEVYEIEIEPRARSSKENSSVHPVYAVGSINSVPHSTQEVKNEDAPQISPEEITKLDVSDDVKRAEDITFAPFNGFCVQNLTSLPLGRIIRRNIDRYGG